MYDTWLPWLVSDTGCRSARSVMLRIARPSAPVGTETCLMMAHWRFPVTVKHGTSHISHTSFLGV